MKNIEFFLGPVGHPQMMPPNYNPIAGQSNPNQPPIHSQDQGNQQLPNRMPQQMGMVYPPQQIPSTAPIMSIGQPPTQNSSQGNNYNSVLISTKKALYVYSISRV